MYYDDEARRFNFISGLLLGAVLGTGLALLAAPQNRTTVSARGLGKATARAGKRARASIEDARDRGQRASEGAFTRVRAAAERSFR